MLWYGRVETGVWWSSTIWNLSPYPHSCAWQLKKEDVEIPVVYSFTKYFFIFKNMI